MYIVVSRLSCLGRLYPRGGKLKPTCMIAQDVEFAKKSLGLIESANTAYCTVYYMPRAHHARHDILGYNMNLLTAAVVLSNQEWASGSNMHGRYLACRTVLF